MNFPSWKKVMVIYPFLLSIIWGCSTHHEVKKEPLQVSVQTPSDTERKELSPQKGKAYPVPEPLLPLKSPYRDKGLDSLVSIRITEGGLKELCHALAEQAKVNLIIDPDVEDERVSISIKEIPLWQALDAILTSHGLYYTSEPGYIHISRMITRTFHLDYVVSVRAGASSTQVSLSSGTSGISGPGQTQQAGTMGGSVASGDIVIQTQERVDFWTQLDARIRELMRDPLYEILRSEYDRKVLKRQLHMLPMETEYSKELMKHRLHMFRLERELAKKRMETGAPEGAVAPREAFPYEVPEAKEAAKEEREEEKKGRLVGSYTIDPQTGTIIVTTTSEIMARIEKFINQVRENLTRQVHIDLQILEVSLRKEKKLGIDWSGFPGLIQFFRMPRLRSVIEAQIEAQATAGAGGAGAAGGGGIYSPLTSSPFSSSPVGGLQAGILITPTSGQAVQFALNSIISFLKQQGDVRAISRPQITTLNNQPAVISVGVNDFFITFEQATTATAGGLATTQVTSRLNPIFIGVTLHITPQLSPQGEIIMKIVPAVNERVGEKVVPTGIPSAPTQTIPILETRQTSTVVKAEDGQTIILSGLIQERDILLEKGVPFLSDLPVVGPIFRHMAKEKGRSELVILLTPRLADVYPRMEGLGYKELPGKK